MMATAVKKSLKSNIKTVARKAKVVKLPPKQVLAWLQANPGFFEKHKDALGSLAVPKKGGNILSLHAAKADKSAAENQKLRARQKQLVAMASYNVKTAESLFGAMVGLMRCKNAADVGKFVQGELRTILDVPVIKIYRCGQADTATTLTAETIADWCPEPVILKPLDTATEREVYGAKGKMLKSDCRLQLWDNGKLVGLMLIASGEATRFHAGQGTELVAQFGRAVGAALGRVGSK